MCNLYSQSRSRDEVARVFRVPHNRAAVITPAQAIFPGHSAAVVRLTDGDRELAEMSWGFVLPQDGRAPRRVTNTRDDKVLSSRFWSSSFKARRCLVPATSFCEPHDGRKPATWHWFALKGEEPRPLFAFAGIWQSYKGPLKKDGPIVETETYSFMTTEPNALTQSINHERCPLLLTDEAQCQTWLTGTPEAAFAMIKPFDGERLRIVQEGFSKRDDMAAA